MKSHALLFTLVAAACTMAGAALNVIAQTLGNSAKPAVLSAAAASQAAEDAVFIQAALNHFDSALAARDAGQLQAVGIKPTSVKAWQKFFRNNPGATVTDACPVSTLAILGDTATWNCTETATLISQGKPISYPLAVHFTFIQRNGVWMISDRR